jgi:hypothetical protein
VEHPRDPFDFVVGLRERVAELHATVRHIQSELAEVKQDVRRLDDRIFGMMILGLLELARRREPVEERPQAGLVDAEEELDRRLLHGGVL